MPRLGKSIVMLNIGHSLFELRQPAMQQISSGPRDIFRIERFLTHRPIRYYLGIQKQTDFQGDWLS